MLKDTLSNFDPAELTKDLAHPKPGKKEKYKVLGENLNRRFKSKLEQNSKGLVVDTCNYEKDNFDAMKSVEPAHPKPGKKKKTAKDTPETIAHKNWVASQPCMIPGCSGRSSVHHIRINGEPKDHFKTIPFCYEHHQGDTGIHGMGKHEFRKIHGNELDMLDELMKRKLG